jgi:peptidoglycan/xylan/chitin deacetylase (PgdA/CDA1 family)
MGFIPVLYYHSIGNDELSVSPSAFRRSMMYLKKRGYRTIQFGDLATLARRRYFPGKTVCITFDDCFEGVYRYAIPILEEFGFTATCFAVIDYMAATLWGVSASKTWRRKRQRGDIGYRLMDWNQVCDLHVRNFEIGAHTVTHPRLEELPADGVQYELAESKRRLEQRLGASVVSFAYPFGSYNHETTNLTRQAGYAVACTTQFGYVDESSDLYALPRIPGPTLLADIIKNVENLSPNSLRGKWNQGMRLAERGFNIRRVASRCRSWFASDAQMSQAGTHSDLNN